MFKAASLVAIAGSASAFLAPQSKTSSVVFAKKASTPDAPAKSPSLPFADFPSQLVGVELAGNQGFDPAGFAASSEASVARYAAIELKHGRFAMLAMLGIVVQEFVQLNEFFPSKNFLEALGTAPQAGLWQIVLAISAHEILKGNYQGERPGDFGFDPFNLSKGEYNEKYALAEVKHGRLAMMGFLGCLIQQLLSPVPVVQQAADYVASF
jgi:hypothetical protein